jgi:hypothetical protein
VAESDILERQPLELNFRYKLNDKHVSRLNLPMAWKVNSPAGLLHQLPSFDMDESIENKSEAYWDALKHDDTYAIYDKISSSYYNLLGISLGYDYDFYLGAGFSGFAGINLAYYYHYRYLEYFSISYSKLDDNNTSNLKAVEFVKRHNIYNAYLIKPMLGVRYQFQKVIIEGSAGYSYGFWNGSGSINNQHHTSNNIGKFLFSRDPEKLKQIICQLSLFYTF